MTTKEKILQILNNCQNEFVSGESLAKEFDISRAAIWKAIRALQNEGCKIESSKHDGYKLLTQTDIFSENLFRAELEKLNSLYSNSHIECFKEIDSTNSHAMNILSKCGALRDFSGTLTESGIKFNKSIFVAESQTAGRGRLGRTFVSPEKTGIYMSLIFAPKDGISDPAKITAFTAVAVAHVLEKLFNVDAKIKWVNDIFINGKKVCGILTEGTMNFETRKIEAAVIGIGINIFKNSVFTNSADLKLKNVAGSILQNEDFKNAKITRAKIAAEIVNETFSIFEQNSSIIIDEYRKRSFLIGQTVNVHPIIDDEKSVYSAQVLNIDDDANLVVKLPDGTTRALYSGEVSIKSENII